ncbi:hypothetical protein NC653_028304 [Populus alba x Populus x berolinensis]|uniref:Uncharacterized protein n=1 Tax=Populus alba x Populus x berolinensis TaxID=444605 RepID=A0AAD6M7P3_9ROSI|nr:hypothetical protein NC653_028304 [Populus alba x Populus x berolinensis]
MVLLSSLQRALLRLWNCHLLTLLPPSFIGVITKCMRSPDGMDAPPGFRLGLVFGLMVMGWTCFRPGLGSIDDTISLSPKEGCHI